MGDERVALLSVSNKVGLAELATRLKAARFLLISTGGSARTLREAGLDVTDVSAYTASPEVMGGRVKTLHPRVHGGILMRETASDREELQALGGAPIDLVVCNLYPFLETVAGGASFEEAIENIDIGGPSMIRSAAKNHSRTTVVVDPVDYARIASAFEHDQPSVRMRRELALKAFSHTAAYDRAISDYLSQQLAAAPEQGQDPLPATLHLNCTRQRLLRYGENPHQKAALYRLPNASPGSLALAGAREGAKALSYNNLVDAQAALDAVREFDAPAVVFVKHTNPCGVAIGDERASLSTLCRMAREADALSAFGGIVAANRQLDRAAAEVLAETFLECIIAPGFAPDARKELERKKSLRLIEVEVELDLLEVEQDSAVGAAAPYDVRTVDGGLLVQTRDLPLKAEELTTANVVTKRQPEDDELQALNFAWKVCKHVKSNAIVLATGSALGAVDSPQHTKSGAGLFRTLGIGAGQMSRVKSVDIALSAAGEGASGCVLASDAFFPFADGVEAAAEGGVRAIVQPGGSVRDEEVIEAADRAGIAMMFTGTRHFRH